LSHVGLVINYELPDSADALTHRVGRTARNGKTGRALTFITAEDQEKWAKLRRQGAPPLRSVDAAAFARCGDWLYLEEGALMPAATGRKSATDGRQRSTPMRRRWTKRGVVRR
ncbi:MAG TPA: hypothetical protein VHQ03_03595, partial [Candidatus Dormibacteraeota bacterium]|nr:hypothetical protein [Candidatus Dormibacteraeota bacterium]